MAKEQEKQIVETPNIWAIGKNNNAIGELRKLKKQDFPKTKEGKVAFCNYMIEKWKAKRTQAEQGKDPTTKLFQRKNKLLAKLAEINKQITEAGGTKPNTK